MNKLEKTVLEQTASQVNAISSDCGLFGRVGLTLFVGDQDLFPGEGSLFDRLKLDFFTISKFPLIVYNGELGTQILKSRWTPMGAVRP